MFPNFHRHKLFRGNPPKHTQSFLNIFCNFKWLRGSGSLDCHECFLESCSLIYTLDKLIGWINSRWTEVVLLVQCESCHASVCQTPHVVCSFIYTQVLTYPDSCKKTLLDTYPQVTFVHSKYRYSIWGTCIKKKKKVKISAESTKAHCHLVCYMM